MKEKKNIYDVTITRTGGITVEAVSKDEAIELVNNMDINEIDKKGNLTGWETSDAVLLEEKRKETYYNTKRHGGIVAYPSLMDEVNKIAIETKAINFIGTDETYDSIEYMFFHDEKRKKNYAVKIVFNIK